jgi:hypothetical protein
MRKWSTVKKKYDYITTIEPFVSCDGLMKYELQLCVFLYVCDCECLCVVSVCFLVNYYNACYGFMNYNVVLYL